MQLKNCQFYPKLRELIFENHIFWKIIFKNQFFSEKFKKNRIQLKKSFENFFLQNFRIFYLDLWKKIFCSTRLLKMISQEIQKQINCSSDMIIIWTTSNAHNLLMYHHNEMFDTFIWEYLVRSFTRNSEL